MRALWDTRHPIHVWSGWLVVAVCFCITGAVALKRPQVNETSLAHRLFAGTRGEKGQWTEVLPRGEYTLICESSEGNEKIMKLVGVTARYVESPPVSGPSQRTLVWHITAPTATHEANGTVDTLDGPLTIEVRDIHGILLGSGKSVQDGPALRRESDVWQGLAPLRWVQEDEMGRGEYLLPKGWRKEKDDRFVVEEGPVVWNSLEPGLVSSLTADALNAKDVSSGVLNSVTAKLDGDGVAGGGKIWAECVEVAGQTLRFLAPIRFEHQLGWSGTATEGLANRAVSPDSDGTSESPGSLDLFNFQASGLIGDGFSGENISSINVHSASAKSARWTAAGLQMEGNVTWDLEVAEKNGKATRYILKAPRTYYRSGLGRDLPEGLALWSVRSEGGPHLAWDGNTLSSPGMTYQLAEQTWHLERPVTGTVPGGSFSAGSGSGSASGWIFTTPIRAELRDWGSLRGNRMVWEEKPDPAYTFTGNPAILTNTERRLSGDVIFQTGNQLIFPSGIQGSITFKGETFTLRADRAEIIGDGTSQGTHSISLSEIRLSGRVECSAPDYRFSSRDASIKFDGDRPRHIEAKGGISLQGSLGSGFGDTLELFFENGWRQPNINWSGGVRGKVEVSIDR